MMKDEELLELARKAGWTACDPAIRQKLIAFGKLVVKRKNHPLKKEANEETVNPSTPVRTR